jgi:hypothetical protein
MARTDMEIYGLTEIRQKGSNRKKTPEQESRE